MGCVSKVWFLVRQLFVVYLILTVVLFLAQSFFIFPGSYFDSRVLTESDVNAPPGTTVLIKTLQREDSKSFRIAQVTPQKVERVILFFGGNAEHFDTIVQRALHFSRYSAMVVVAEPAGWGKSEGPLDVDTQCQLAAKVGEYAQQLAQEKGLELAVVGSSLGSFSAIHVASVGIGSKLLLHAPLTSIEELAVSMYWIFPVRTFLKKEYKFDNNPKFAPLQSRCQKDDFSAMVIHGNIDEIVHQNYGITVCKEIGDCCQFVNAVGYKHNDVPLFINGHFAQTILNFLKS